VSTMYGGGGGGTRESQENLLNPLGWWLVSNRSSLRAVRAHLPTILEREAEGERKVGVVQDLPRGGAPRGLFAARSPGADPPLSGGPGEVGGRVIPGA